MIDVSQHDRRPGARSDAQRNRQRIIDAATRALTSGAGPVKIETIAREAESASGRSTATSRPATPWSRRSTAANWPASAPWPGTW
ncbi:hypothetical protein GCM10029964_085210 [Kibdelosporangium lantanae]